MMFCSIVTYLSHSFLPAKPVRELVKFLKKEDNETAKSVFHEVGKRMLCSLSLKLLNNRSSANG